MVRLLSIITVCILGLISCQDKSNQPIVISGNTDSLLVEYIVDQFDYRHNRNSIESQLISMKQGINEGAYFQKTRSLDNYQLNYFQFDLQTYPAFAAEVTNANGEVISFFTFSDELYYRGNNHGSEHYFDDRCENKIPLNVFHGCVSDSVILVIKSSDDRDLLDRLNLERNLNELILRLGYQCDQYKIVELLESVFCELLWMRNYDDEELLVLVNSIKGTEELHQAIQKEYQAFTKDEGFPTLRFRSHQGIFGYWKLSIERDGECFKVRTKFFSDVLFYALFM